MCNVARVFGVVLLFYAVFFRSVMGRRGRPQGPAPAANQRDLLQQLNALAQPPQDLVRHAGHMRETRARYAKEHAEAVLDKKNTEHDEDLSIVALAGGLHVSRRGNAKTVHPKSWSAMQILRTAFCPAPATATATVLEFGMTGPRDCRSVTAGAILDCQRKGILSKC